MGIITETKSKLGKKSIGWTDILAAWGKAAFGELDYAINKFAKAGDVCEESGWYSLCWQARVFKGLIESVKGDYRQAEKTLKTLRNQTISTPALEFWVHTVELGLHTYIDSDLHTVTELYEKTKKIRSDWKPKGTQWYNTEIVMDTVLNGLSCFVLLRKSNPLAIEYAQRTVHLSHDMSYVFFSAIHFSLKVVCESLISIWRDKLDTDEKAEIWANISIARIQSLLKDALVELSRIHGIYYVAGSTILYYKGMQAKFERDTQNAEKFFREGLKVAKRAKLTLDEGLYTLELAQLESPPKFDQLFQATEIIEKTGAYYHLSIARRAFNPDLPV